MPRAEYVEYLKANGATDEDVKALADGSNAAAAIRAFDAMQARFTTESEARVRAEQAKSDYDKWYSEQWAPQYAEMQQKVALAEGNEAKARTVIQALQEQGLADLAKKMGYDPAKPPAAPPSDANAFDPNKYLTRDQILQIAQQEGEAIAIAQDIAAEHRVLFPDKPLNFRDLRKEAVAAKKPVEQLWMDRFGVVAARENKAKSERDAEVAKLVADQLKVKEAEMVARFGNPDLRAPVPSTSPFTTRPNTTRDKQPWERNENDLQADRVARATQKVLERSAVAR